MLQNTLMTLVQNYFIMQQSIIIATTITFVCFKAKNKQMSEGKLGRKHFSVGEFDANLINLICITDLQLKHCDAFFAI